MLGDLLETRASIGGNDLCRRHCVHPKGIRGVESDVRSRCNDVDTSSDNVDKDKEVSENVSNFVDGDCAPAFLSQQNTSTASSIR